MKIIVFENEYNNVKGAFQVLNIVHFGGLAVIKNYVKYQDCSDVRELDASDFIFVDIDLAPTSTLDGFGIIKQLLANNYPLKKMAVLTGHMDMRTRLLARGINQPISIVTKPVTYKELFKVMT
jgi:two-component SAPR family response regulator